MKLSNKKSNKLSKKIISGIVCLSLGILCIIYATIGVMHTLQLPNSLLKQIVVLEEPKILPENEGKLLFITGTTSWQQAEDKELGIKVDSPWLERKVEMLEEVKREGDNTYDYRWIQAPRVRNGDLNEDYQSEVFKTDMYIGEFKLDPYLMNQLRSQSTTKSVDTLDPNIAKKNHMEVAFYDRTIYEPEYFAYEWEYWHSIDLKWDYVRARYEYLDTKPFEEITVIAYQKDGTLTEERGEKRDRAQLGRYVFAGKMDLEDAINKAADQEQMSYITLYIIATIFIFIGIWRFRKKSHPMRKKTNKVDMEDEDEF